MKTDALIAALAADTAPVPAGAVGRRLRLAAALGCVGGLVILLAWLGVRHDLMPAMRTPGFWIKAGYTLWLSLGGALLIARLARPGGRAGPATPILAAGLIAIVLLGAVVLVAAPADQRAVMVMGHSWRLCPWRILVIAAPVFAALIWGLRRFAPTRLTLTGAAAGLLAGALGASVYGLACTESSPTFVAIWYTLGISLCAAIGAASGRWLLRW